MSILHRIVLLIGVAILSMLTLTGVSYFEMARVYEATNYGNVNVIPSIEILNRVSVEFGRQRTRLYRAEIDHQDRAVVAEAETGLAEGRSKILAAFKDYEPLVSDAEDGRLLEAQRKAFEAYTGIIGEIMAAIHQGRIEDARAITAKAAPEARNFLAQLAAHMAYNRKLGEKVAAEGVAAKQQWVWINLAVLAAALGAILAMGVLTARQLNTRLKEANELAARVATGDLSAQGGGQTASTDEIGQLLKSLDAMRAGLASTIGEIKRSADTVVGSAQGLARTSREVTSSSEVQNSATAAAAAAVEELTVSIDTVGNSADEANQRAVEAGSMAESSARDVSEAAHSIRDVANRVADTAAQMQSLSEQVQHIGKITTVIRDVADQTNLLALNAAIEAARAGDQGRGFAVVADEVRKLAERTTSSVQEISSVIDTIQRGAASAVDSMAASQAVVEKVVVTAGSASDSMTQIRQSAETVQASVDGISTALREQRTASNELARNVEAIAQMSEKNAVAVATVADTASQLENVSDSLRATVARFRL